MQCGGDWSIASRVHQKSFSLEGAHVAIPFAIVKPKGSAKKLVGPFLLTQEEPGSKAHSAVSMENPDG